MVEKCDSVPKRLVYYFKKSLSKCNVFDLTLNVCHLIIAYSCTYEETEPGTLMESEHTILIKSVKEHTKRLRK